MFIYGNRRFDGKINDPFNYSLHEALTSVEKEVISEKSIVEIIQDSFKYEKEVIRYVKVIVSCKPKPPEPKPGLEEIMVEEAKTEDVPSEEEKDEKGEVEVDKLKEQKSKKRKKEKKQIQLR
ncbi:hypothetical protein LCGC14_1317780 [marine sediment metagenome]|uniref:Uncharacterized protein n=1 Tax=marine sediment metagenome TaxID=412755 RepID=A0A0F9KKF6_9ZZZZ